MDDRQTPERSEVYERIPWEHLEKTSTDRQWLYVGLAGAIALGVLAYSFVKNQPVEPQQIAESVATTQIEDQSPDTGGPRTPDPSVSTPIVVAEADLYAVDPRHLSEVASTHAEWFAVEYFSVDGSEVSKATLRSLLPDGIPLPEYPEGKQVFVDWVRTSQVVQSGEAEYSIDVLVRSLVSTEVSGFARQPVRMIRVSVRFGADGQPRVTTAPMVMEVPLASANHTDLSEVPADVADLVADEHELIGGTQSKEGGWRLIVMTVGVDGVKRPHLIEVP